MKLFEVAHEPWEDIATCEPPDGALAFQLEGALWIFTKEGLDAVRDSATLRYTQHGVDLLREAGYEG